jgi:NitT/TauT family transport system substrate-binding protein
MMVKQARSSWITLMGICLVMLLAACNSAQVTEPPVDRISLQLQWVTQAQFAGYYVALDKGWYSEEGIDLTIVPGGPDLIPVDLVRSGARDFGTSLLADLAVAIQGGAPVISIAQIQQTNGLMLVTRADSGITGPQDFAGHTVGVWLGSWQTQFDALVAQAGLSPGEFTLVAQGYSMDPFLNGELDVASAMIYNEYHTLLESGLTADELTVIDYSDYGLGFPGDTLFTSTALAEGNEGLCIRMVRASLRGWQYAIEHPDEAAEIVLKYDQTGMQTREHQLAMMEEIAKLVTENNRELGYSDEAAVQLMIDNLVRYGVLSGSLDADEVYTNQFWELATTGE